MNCPYCSSEIVPQQDFVTCPSCITFYHADCWHANDNRCARLGCSGAGSLPTQTFRRESSSRAPRKRSLNVRFVIPGGGRRASTMIASTFACAASWGLIGWAAVSVALIPLESEPSGWPKLAAIAAAFAGLLYIAKQQEPAWEREFRRLLWALSGFVVFRLTMQLIIGVVTLSELSWPIRQLSPESAELVAGWIGVLVGGLWLTVGGTLLRGAVVAVLATYLGASLAPTQPGFGSLYDLPFWLLAVSAGAMLLTMIFTFSLNPLISAAVAIVPGFWLLRQLDSAAIASTVLAPYRMLISSVLLALPLAGSAHAHGYGLLASEFIAGATPDSQNTMRAVRSGIVGVAFTVLVASLSVLGAGVLVPLSAKLLVSVLRLTTVQYLLAESGVRFVAIPSNLAWLTLLLVYSLVFAIGFQARTGVLHQAYRFIRLLALILLSCLVALLVEQGLERAIEHWFSFQSILDHASWVRIILPTVALSWAILFVLLFRRDRMPIILTELGFGLWIAQVGLMVSIMALAGGITGRWIGSELGAWLDGRGIDRISSLEWSVSLAIIGVSLGFFLIAAYSTGRLLVRNPGILVSEYRRMVQKYWMLADAGMEHLLTLQMPWWLLLVFGLLAIACLWQFGQWIQSISQPLS